MRGRWRRGIALLPVLGLVFFLSACGPAQRPGDREDSRERESSTETLPQPPASREQTTTEAQGESASSEGPGESPSPEPSEASSPESPTEPASPAAGEAPEELESLRRQILKGEILALNGGRPVGEDYGGFRIDLDGSSGEELITLEPDLLYGERPVFRLLIEGRPAGTPLSPELEKNASWKELLAWPDESVFSREEEAKLYLASPDGEGIVLFLERAGETYGLIPEKGEEGLRLRTRFRGPGKTMEDFIPRQGLKEYIAQGWLVRPGNQDRLDLTGDGEEETILVRPEEGDALIPFGEIISAREMPEEARIVFEGFSSGGSPVYFRYGNLYYALNSQGGYDLMAELLVQGELRRVCYQLMDFNARPLVRGDSFAHASYRAAGFVSGPAPGWEGVSEAARRAYEEEKGGKAPVASRELGELRQFFSSLFAAHFLLDEYEDVRDIPLEHLFYDGIEWNPAPHAEWPVVGPNRLEIDALLGNQAGLPIQALSRSAAEEAFWRMTQVPFSELRGEMPGHYYARHDCWYFTKGDTANSACSILEGYYEEDGSLCLLWRRLPAKEGPLGLVRLRRGEEGWQILSNRFLPLQ